MVAFKNLRTAIQKGREWWAQRTLAKQSKLFRKKRAYEKKAQLSRREFIGACRKAAIIPLGIAAIGGPLTYYLLTKKVKSNKTSSAQTYASTPKEAALQTLDQVLEKKTMSPRYITFIKTIIRLIKDNKIHFRVAKITGKPIIADALYHPKSNTVEISPKIFSKDNVISKCVLIHELFHAYQDFLEKKIKASVREAEAHLAEGDYLYHHGIDIPESWINLLTDEKHRVYPVRFNVPLSLIQKCHRVAFTSKIYTQVVQEIADNQLWMLLYEDLLKTAEKLSPGITARLSSTGKIINLRKTALIELMKTPKNQERIRLINKFIRDGSAFPGQSHLLIYMATSHILARKLWAKGKVSETRKAINETFEKVKEFLQPADLSPLDTITNVDGIH